MPSVVIAGASRGLGFGLLDVWSQDESNLVVGLVRNLEEAKAKVASELPGRTNIKLERYELEDFKSLQDARDEISKIVNGKLDVLIANAAVSGTIYGDIGDVILKDVEKYDAEMWKTIYTNAVCTSHLLAVFISLVQRRNAKTVAVMTSGACDARFMVDDDLAGHAPYAISKAALNAVVAKFQAQHKDEGIMVSALSPGIVDTGFIEPTDDPDYGRLLGKFGAALATSLESHGTIGAY